MNSLTVTIREAVDILRNGGVIALPTETVYGLACDPRNAKAVKKIFAIKGRVESKPLQLIAGSFAQVAALAEMTAAEKTLSKRHWPGPLTLLVHLQKRQELAKQVNPGRVIGIRVTSGKIAGEIARAFGHPIAATSANRSGSLPATSARGVRRAFRGYEHQPDGIVESSAIPRRKPSTVARVKKDGEIEVLRQGAIKVLPSKKGRLVGI